MALVIHCQKNLRSLYLETFLINENYIYVVNKKIIYKGSLKQINDKSYYPIIIKMDNGKEILISKYNLKYLHLDNSYNLE